MNSVLQVENLSKSFLNSSFLGKKECFTAVDNISFALQEGEILGLLGPNGAGKTTTIQMLLGLLTPTSGSIHCLGKNLLSHRSAVMEQIAFVSPYSKLPGSLTVLENLKFYAFLYNVPAHLREQRIAKNLSQFALEELKDRLTKNLSAGQLTRLMLAKAFLSNPRIILLDEPTAALDPDIAVQVRRFIIEQRQNFGVSVLLTSHNMSEVEDMCDRVIVMKQGRIIAADTPKQLVAVIKTSRLSLLVTNLDKAINFAKSRQISFRVNGQHIEFDIDEREIPEFLSDIMRFGLKYLEIAIAKPTLEDYFLSIAAQKVGL